MNTALQTCARRLPVLAAVLVGSLALTYSPVGTAAEDLMSEPQAPLFHHGPDEHAVELVDAAERVTPTPEPAAREAHLAEATDVILPDTGRPPNRPNKGHQKTRVKAKPGAHSGAHPKGTSPAGPVEKLVDDLLSGVAALAGASTGVDGRGPRSHGGGHGPKANHSKSHNPHRNTGHPNRGRGNGHARGHGRGHGRGR